MDTFPTNFTTACDQHRTFKKSISRVIPIAGPLRMSFHMLQSTFTLFEKLILVTKGYIGWKLECIHKNSKFLRIENPMCSLIYKEIYRCFFYRFLKSVYDTVDYNVYQLLSDDEKYDELCIQLSANFAEWINMKNNSDDNVKYLINYLIVMSNFQLHMAS